MPPLRDDELQHYTVLEGAAYDLRKLGDRHPGGALALTFAGGRDLSRTWAGLHGFADPQKTRAWLTHMRVRDKELERRIVRRAKPDAYDVRRREGWVYHLVANACQSIAVKLQETVRVDPDTLQRHFDVRFDRVCVLKMESLVLRELGWAVNDVVPAAYPPRLLHALGFSGDEHAALVHKTDLFLLSTLYDPTMTSAWPPSVLAAAAVALALNDANACDVGGVVRRVRELFEADAGSSSSLSRGSEPAPAAFDADAAVACARALEAFRDALTGAAEQRR